MECKFTVGQKVVCINATPNPAGTYPFMTKSDMHGLTVGQVYTVRDVFINLVGHICIRLNEIIRPTDSTGNLWAKGTEAGWREIRFKPLETKKTDISIFTDMLNKSPIDGKIKLKQLEDA